MKLTGKRVWLAAIAMVLSMVSFSIVHAELLADWEFNADDVSGSSVNATTGTAANITGTLIGGADVSSQLLDLDGTDDYLQFGNNLTDLRGLSVMTICAWVKCGNSRSDRRRIIEHEDNFYFYKEGGKYIFTVHAGGDSVMSTTAPAVNTWQHVLAVYQAGQPARMYINGVLEASSGNMNAMLNNVQTFQIGANRSGSGPAAQFLSGDLDDVAIWNEVLSIHQIELLAGKNAGGYDGRYIPTGLDYLPVVYSGIPTAIGKSEATLNGELIDEGHTSTEVRLYWGTTDGGSDISAWANTNSFGTMSVGSVSTNLTGLTPNTTYYYRFYATNATDYAWSDQGSFKTWSYLPDEFSGLQLWLKADQGVYADSGTTSATNGDVVTQWNDYSGNDHDATRVGSVQNVKLVHSLSAMPMLSFTDNTGDDYLEALNYSVADTDNLTVFVVAKAVQQTNGSALHPLVCSGNPSSGGGAFNIMMSRPIMGDNLGYSGRGYEAYPYQEYLADDMNPNFVDGKIHVITLTISDVSGGGVGTLTGHYDGALKAINNGKNNNPANGPIQIGGTSSTLDRRFAGSLGDILIYNRVLSDNEWNKVGWYLQQKYSAAGIYRDPQALFMTNTAPSSLTQTSAIFNGEILDGELPAIAKMYWGTTDEGTDAAAWANTNDFGSVTALGSLSTNITGLTQGTRYYYRYYGSNSVGEVWTSNSIAFATLGTPVFNTLALTRFDDDSATAKGSLFSAGGSATTVKLYFGIVNGGTDNGAWDDSVVFEAQSVGTLLGEIPGLAANTTYFCRYYAENSSGGIWSEPALSFTTSEKYFIKTDNLVLWLRADAGVTVNNGMVELWDDQAADIGGMNNAAGTGSSTPLLVSSAIGGKPAIQFDGIDDFLAVPDHDALDLGTGADKGWTVICVYHRAAGSTIGIASQSFITKTSTGSSDTDYILFAQDDNLLWGTGIATDSGAWMAFTEPALAPHIVLCTLNQTGTTSGNKTLNIDGSEATSGAYAEKAVANTVPVTIGGQSASQSNLKGLIAEILVYNTNLSDYQQNEIGWYLQQKYGISGSYEMPPMGTVIIIR